MNWATLEPENRLYKGKLIFRWEVSPGLEHHCGICATPLHNARAKTSCIGKHVEPCYRFHQQLHFVGKSHECFGCNSSDEMHHNRHKEILKIIRELSLIDQDSAIIPQGPVLSASRPRRGSTLTTSTNTCTDTSSTSESVSGENSGTTSKLSRRERKKAKKASNNSTPKDKRNVEVFTGDELDFVSEAIHLTIHESKGAWEGTYVYDHKAPSESIEEGNAVDDGDLESDVDNLAGTINALSVKSPLDLTARQRKTMKKFTSSINHASFRGGSRKFSPLPGPKLDPYDGVDPKIFFRLGVEVAYPVKNSKIRKELVTKLIAAIKEDIEIIEREDEETVMREEGFWRWAGKTAYHEIMATRQELDWATGQKRSTPRIEVEPEEEEQVEETPTQATFDVKIKVPQTPAQAVNEDGWQKVGKAPKTPTPKIYAKSNVAVTKKNVLKRVQPANAFPKLDAKDKEDAAAEGDLAHLVSRYEQRLTGKRDVNSSTPTSDKRRGGRLIISVK